MRAGPCYESGVSAARAHALRFYVSVAVVVSAVVIGVVLGARYRRSGATRAADAPLAADVADWCPPGLDPIAGGGCFAPAPVGAPARGLIIYLHGRYGADGVNDERERQQRVARLGGARGYHVLALRGAQGQCSDPQLATWWCWPSNERNVDDGPRFIARAAPAIAEAERRAGPGRRLLLGFSNGGYFAALIASRALLPLDAVAIAHAGPVEPMRPVGKTPPVLLIDADDDPSGPEMDRLEAALSRESWPHAMVAREGGHALPEWDVTMALTFFDRTRTESLPLSPPLSSRARRIHPLLEADASDPASSGSGSASAPSPPSPPSSAAAPPSAASAPEPVPEPSPPDPAPSE